MSYDKIYKDNMVSGASIRDGKGNRIDTMYLSKDEFNIFTRIGQPQLSLDNVLPINCVWLEGATVSRTTYSKLFAVYGTTYGEGDGSTTFVLPNFLNRAVCGSNDFGYIEAGLPNITGNLGFSNFALNWGTDVKPTASGSFKVSDETKIAGSARGGGSGNNLYKFNASFSNSIYGKSNTVQPPAIKVRVYARYQ